MVEQLRNPSPDKNPKKRLPLVIVDGFGLYGVNTQNFHFKKEMSQDPCPALDPHIEEGLFEDPTYIRLGRLRLEQFVYKLSQAPQYRENITDYFIRTTLTAIGLKAKRYPENKRYQNELIYFQQILKDIIADPHLIASSQ